MLQLFPLHPRFVHFPIALLLTGSLVGLVYLLGWRRPGMPALAWGTLLLGWLALFAAVLSGLIDQNRASQDESVVAVLNQHIAAGMGLIVLYGLLLYQRLRAADVLDDPKLRWRIIVLLLLGVGLVIVEGTLGGRLVYEYGIGVMSKTP